VQHVAYCFRIAAAGVLCTRFVGGVEGHQELIGHGGADATFDAQEGFHAGLAYGVTTDGWQKLDEKASVSGYRQSRWYEEVPYLRKES
jgi:hypothetical protein